jgi:hypothetical protein
MKKEEGFARSMAGFIPDQPESGLVSPWLRALERISCVLVNLAGHAIAKRSVAEFCEARSEAEREARRIYII